ncbi:N-6 DNA methylase (plasmid) [Paenibacillus sp. EC2-1]|uniref:N-6 DNA methylase n=1 Tax=Paenibacillus sp. EC2-1 TaxID=3388665 RepID=UPI003BEF11B3
MMEVKMLSGLLDIVKDGQEVSEKEAYDLLLQFVGYKIGAEEGMPSPTLRYKVWQDLEDRLDLGVLLTDPWDWFGELYKERVFNKFQPFMGTRSAAAHLITKLSADTSRPKGEIVTMYDPIVGSGRMFIATHAAVGDHFLYYGCEPELTAYRTCLVNMKLYKINAKILHADERIYSSDIKSKNWKYANWWTPPDSKKHFERRTTTAAN